MLLQFSNFCFFYCTCSPKISIEKLDFKGLCNSIFKGIKKSDSTKKNILRIMIKSTGHLVQPLYHVGCSTRYSIAFSCIKYSKNENNSIIIFPLISTFFRYM